MNVHDPMLPDKTNTVIQWNCRGLKSNFEELALILNQYNPVAVCLQETFLKLSDKIKVKNYTFTNKVYTNADRACGGVSIMVNNKTPHRIIPLNTRLQATAVSISLKKTFTLCSLYLPPSFQFNRNDLESLIAQLPTPFILTGDFNAHSKTWGCQTTNDRGLKVEDFILNNNLCLFNTKSSTYIHPASGTTSSLDLTVCSPEIFLDFSWKVDSDSHGSDHFPTIIHEIEPCVQDRLRKWKLHKADWNLFQFLCDQSIKQDLFTNCADPTALFTQLVYDSAEKSIPRTSGKPGKASKPWFTDECKSAIEDRKKALAKLRLRPTADNISGFKIMRAKARRTIKLSKHKSWRDYVSKLNSSTSIKKTWDMIRKISGKHGSSPIKHLKTETDSAETKDDIANLLAKTFSKKSSSENSSPEFRQFKEQQEKKKLNFKSDNNESYNKPFSLKELQKAFKKAHDTAVGPDDIHYQMLKHLPSNCLAILLNIFNQVWETGDFPQSWRDAIVIPIPKPGKDTNDPSNYRPIALTSCICKTMERMVNDRLVWFLESNNLIANVQCGFRRHRGTIDHLIRFETFIREAFIKKEHAVSVFFDLESAYDTTWKYGIMRDLHEFGIRGKLAFFISAFMNDRHFRVRVGSTKSDLHDQEMGVPQGSILSVTLFAIKINNIIKAVNPGVECSLYVDDFVICFRSKHMHTIERQLQQVLNKLEVWSNQNGFKFSKSKTKCMHFSQLRNDHSTPELRLGGTRIEVVPQFKFLGLIFDSKLTFIPHISYLFSKCQKALNLLRVASHTDWGADRSVLLRVYRSHIRSKLDYGCVVYGSARKSYIKRLDSIHHQGLRLALGAFRTSPVNSLYVEANEPSLYHRRNKLSLQYALKLKSSPNNPAYDTVFNPLYKQLFLRKERVIPPFSLRVGPLLEDTSVDLDDIAEVGVLNIPPWTLKSPQYIFDLCADKKAHTDSSIYISKFNEIVDTYSTCQHIYTDGSKDGDAVAAAAVSENNTYTFRLPDKSSIFSAELKAIWLALDHIQHDRRGLFLIFSDSLSCLQALSGEISGNPIIAVLLEKISKLCETKQIYFCWLPSHIGIAGNEKADKAAKSALNEDILPLKVPYTDFRHQINILIKSSWQTSWNDDIYNKLRFIKPVLGECFPISNATRREEVVITRLRIGHTRLTHSYLLNREAAPECIPCFTSLTVAHLFLHCVDVAQIRDKYFKVASMKDLFDNVPVTTILNFLREINVFMKV